MYYFYALYRYITCPDDRAFWSHGTSITSRNIKLFATMAGK